MERNRKRDQGSSWTVAPKEEEELHKRKKNYRLNIM
jgi:hypothetical protein